MAQYHVPDHDLIDLITGTSNTRPARLQLGMSGRIIGSLVLTGRGDDDHSVACLLRPMYTWE
jgi:hypothetical protein